MRRLLLALLLLAPARAEPYQPPPLEIVLPTEVELPPPAARPDELGSEPLTVEEAVNIALRYQSTVAVARTQVQVAEGRTQQTGAQTNPRLNLTSTYRDFFYVDPSLGGGLGGPGGFILGGNQTNATLRQLLFDFGYTRNLVRQNLALEEAARAGYTRSQCDLMFQVKEAFYVAVQNQRLVEVNLSNVKNRQAQLEQANSRFEAGLGLPADVLRAQTAVTSAVFDLSQAQTNAGLARLNLNNLMGIDPRTPLSLKDNPEQGPTTEKVEELFEQALRNRPELTQAVANLEAGRYGVDAANVSSAPQLNASLVYGLNSEPFFNSLSVQLGLNFDLYDGGLQGGRVREAEANREAAQAQLDGVAQTVLTEVGRAYLNLKTAEQRVQTARQAEASASETLRLSTGRYEGGLGIFLDVLEAQAALLAAQTDRVNAQTQVDVARAALNRAIGQPPPAVAPVVRTDEQPSPVSPVRPSADAPPE